MTVRETLKEERKKAERMYAYETSPYTAREARGMIRVVDAVEKAMEESEYAVVRSEFPVRLRLLRTDMGMTQREMAWELGHTERIHAEYENGRKDPGTKRAKEMAETLGVPWMWLIGYGETFPFGSYGGDGYDRP